MSLTYEIYELRRKLIEEVRHYSDIETNWLRNAGLPTSVRRRVQAANTVVQALRLTHERPSFGIDRVVVDGAEVEVTEHVVDRSAFGQVIRFAKGARDQEQPKVLVVPGLAGHYATLVRGTIETLLPDHDVYVADWLNARDVPLSEGPFGLDEYIEHLVGFLQAIGPGTHVLGVCQPAVACLAAAAIMSEDDDPAAPASLILLAGPVDTRVNPSRISEFARRQSVSSLRRMMIHSVPRKFAGGGRRVYPGFLQVSGFMAMDPKRHLNAFVDLYTALRRDDDDGAADRTLAFYDEYFAVLDIAEEFYLDTARRVFKEHHLPRGEFHWRDRRVDPSLIRSALFTIEGANDEMCCPGQTEAAQALCSGIPASHKRHLVQDGVGHYGVFAGSVFESQTYPQIRDFIRLVEAS